MNARPTMVVGFDDSLDGKHAMATAVELAPRLSARVLAVHVVTHEEYGFDPDSRDREFEGWRRLAEIRCEAEPLVETCPGSRYIERRGHPAALLHELADRCGALMIVVGLPHKEASLAPETAGITQELECCSRAPDRPPLERPHITAGTLVRVPARARLDASGA